MNTASLTNFARLLMAALLLSALPGRAGTVISTNLPAGTHIVNVNARTEGAANFGAGQFLWYQPTPTAPSVTLPAGTYRFRIVDPTDAASLYPALTPAQLAEIYTAWTFNSPWVENYLVFKSTATSNASEHQLFDGALDHFSYSSAAAAYAGHVANVTHDKIRPAPPGRAGGPSTYTTEWTFREATTLLFVIPDNGLSDNSGGVSVLISPAPAAPVTAYAQSVLNAGPVAYWRFDEAGGLAAADSAGAFPGTLTSTGASFTGCGVSGNAVSLKRASGGMVNMGASVPGFTNGDYSIMLWVKNTETVRDTVPLGKHAANSQNGYLIQINENSNGGALNKATFTAGAEEVSEAPTSTASVNDGQWHQIVAVYRAGGTHSIHVDGSAAQASAPSQGMPGNSAPFLIGGATQSGVPTPYYTGLVDEVALFNRALSNAEIAALYQAAVPRTEWNLRTDWSNAANPNGVWSYREGANPLPAVTAWQQTLGGWGTAQPGWADSQDGTDRIPFWFRSNGTENFARDYLSGDIVVHTTDVTNGVGNGSANVTWTSPVTGSINICGGVWMGRDIGRSNTWTLAKNGVTLTRGAIHSGDTFNRAAPCTYSFGSGGPAAVSGISVVPGDVIRLQLVRNSTGGDFVGVDLGIVSNATPAATPSFRITNYTRDPATGLSSLTFPSQSGAIYSLWGSPATSGWTVLQATIPGTGADVITTHTAPGAPPRYFYQIRRNAP